MVVVGNNVPLLIFHIVNFFKPNFRRFETELIWKEELEFSAPLGNILII